MEATEKSELLALGRDLAGALQSPWQPRTVSGAFATRGPGELSFTLQHWIDLDRARSPLLLGEAPREEDELRAAFGIFGLSLDDATAEEAALIIAAMQAEIAAGLGAALAMRPENPAESSGDDGFGDWAPIFAALTGQLHLSIAEARALPVAAAYVLLAAHRWNQSWRVAGTPYALRDVARKEDADA